MRDEGSREVTRGVWSDVEAAVDGVKFPWAGGPWPRFLKSWLLAARAIFTCK